MTRQRYITDDVLRKIKQIEIHTRRLLRSALVGDSRSAIKGSGLDFDQIREYQQGDDVRFIDWNASARMNNLLVKQYIEERSRVVLLAVDMSGSADLGSTDTLKHDIMAQVASVIALVTSMGKDRVGLILFSDDVELYLPPGRGRAHTHTIMEYVFGFKPKSRKTDISTALKKLASIKQRDALVFVISDFIDDHINSSYLSVASRLYDLVAVRCLDPRERDLPSIGFLPIQDKETGQTLFVDLRNQHGVHDFLQERIAEQNKLFKQYGVSILDVANNNSFIGDLIKFFRRRMRY
jgi:uncharacterized protein (DUF58 family)